MHWHTASSTLAFDPYSFPPKIFFESVNRKIRWALDLANMVEAGTIRTSFRSILTRRPCNRALSWWNKTFSWLSGKFFPNHGLQLVQQCNVVLSVDCFTFCKKSLNSYSKNCRHYFSCKKNEFCLLRSWFLHHNLSIVLTVALNQDYGGFIDSYRTQHANSFLTSRSWCQTLCTSSGDTLNKPQRSKESIDDPPSQFDGLIDRFVICNGFRVSETLLVYKTFGLGHVMFHRSK